MIKSQRHKELETILTLVLALGVFFWFYKKPMFLMASLLTGLTGLFIPTAGRAIHWVWMQLAEKMGYIMNRIILTIIFIVIVIPLGWITRKTGKSAIKVKPDEISYFTKREHVFTKNDMINPW